MLGKIVLVEKDLFNKMTLPLKFDYYWRTRNSHLGLKSVCKARYS